MDIIEVRGTCRVPWSTGDGVEAADTISETRSSNVSSIDQGLITKRLGGFKDVSPGNQKHINEVHSLYDLIYAQ